MYVNAEYVKKIKKKMKITISVFVSVRLPLHLLTSKKRKICSKTFGIKKVHENHFILMDSLRFNFYVYSENIKF